MKFTRRPAARHAARQAGRALLMALPLLLVLAAPEVLAQVGGGLPDKPAAIMESVVDMLSGIGVAVFTCACLWVGYKLAFAGAQFRDVSNILWGGVLAGGAAGFAAWLFS